MSTPPKPPNEKLTAESVGKNNNQATLPGQDQSVQSSTLQVDDFEMPMEQEVVIAIMRYGDDMMDRIRASDPNWEENMRIAQTQPLPEDDDFAHLPPSQPYDPNFPGRITIPVWSKPEAWILDQDNEGRKLWRNKFTGAGTYKRPEGVPEEDDAFEENMRIVQTQPMPEDDDFAHLPDPEPYDPEADNRYEWAKPEAWVQDQDNEGRKMWRNKFFERVTYQRPEGVLEQDDGSVPLKRLANSIQQTGCHRYL